ncbi:MAG: aldo/keto reductase [Anaerolineales bacterium]
MQTAMVQGVEVPKIGLGTWNMSGEEARKAVLSAMELGYRHIDTAEMYRNEHEVGKAIQEAQVEREDLFLVSKVWTNHLRSDQVVDACKASLDRLQTDYLDLYLVHWPSDSVPLEETMDGMARLLESGEARQVGVSNFSVSQMERASQLLGSKIFCNQVKYHVDHRQDAVVEYGQEQDILVTAYTPLAKGRAGSRQLLEEIGQKHGKSGLQVALRWLIQQDKVVAIPKSSHRDHQKQNLDVLNFELSAEDMARIKQLGRGG